MALAEAKAVAMQMSEPSQRRSGSRNSSCDELAASPLGEMRSVWVTELAAGTNSIDRCWGSCNAVKAAGQRCLAFSLREMRQFRP